MWPSKTARYQRQAIVLNGASVGREVLVGAGVLVTDEMVTPPWCLVLGAPVRVVREPMGEELNTRTT